MFRDERGNIFLTYEGETKGLTDWVKDPRCTLKHHSSLRRRVERMGWDDEKAITYPAKETPPLYIEAWGDRKRLADWMKDPRCKIESIGALSRRLKDGHDPESAMSTPSGHLHGMVTAFGQTKTASKWQEDDVCRVHARTIVKRIQEGMKPEEAIRKPSPKPLGDRTPEEWFGREVRAQQRLKEIKGYVPQQFLGTVIASLGKQAEVAYSNRHPDGEGSFCFGIWTDLRTLPRLVHAMDRADLGLSGRLWKTALAPTSMGNGHLYLFRNWFATDDDGTVVYE